MKLTTHLFVSFDGVYQGPGSVDEDTSGGFDRGGWLVPHLDEDFGRIVGGWFAETDAMLFGTRTYEIMAAHWPHVTDPDDDGAALLNRVPKHVVSSSITDPSWGPATVLGGDLRASVETLKARPGRELQVHGSGALVRSLHDLGLIDEYRFLVFPTVVGTGKRIFADGSVPRGLERVGGEVTSTGVVHHVFRSTDFTVGRIGIDDEGRETRT